MMKPFIVFSIFLSVFVQLPIWFYLVYTMLAAIHPDRLVWFLFWIYAPVSFLTAALRATTAITKKQR